MAHFAELDINNKVLRVVVACNQDIADNGGEQSEQAAEHFKTVCPFFSNGVKWVQTSYINNFRKQYAGIGYTFNSTKNKFIAPQPFTSWSLDFNDDWQAPVTYPTDTENKRISWDEENQKWIALDLNGNSYNWDASALAWVSA
tara:strand:+ start:40 stop:468 length:429 start_codon:yes stop_codon:yes gene_type:complete